MRLLLQYLAIGAAGSLGCMLRYFVGSTCGRLFNTSFPIGTFVINVTGSIFLGWFMAVTQERGVVSETFAKAVSIGFVGGYTTFSTYMYESNASLEKGAGIEAAVNLIGSIVVGLIGVRLGIMLGRR
jgi:fluoride exporter